MPNGPYDLPELPFSWRSVHFPSLPEVLRDYGDSAPRMFTDPAEAWVPTDGAAREAGERIERLLARTWNEFQAVSRAPDGLGRLALYRDHFDRLIPRKTADGRKPPVLGDEDDEVALTVVRFRNDVLELFLDRLVAVGEPVPTWDGLGEGERRGVWWSATSPTVSQTMADYLKAGSEEYRHMDDHGTTYESWREVGEAIRRRLPDRTRLRGWGGGEVQVDSVLKRFSRAGYRVPGAVAINPEPEQVQEFLKGIHKAWEGYQAVAGGGRHQER